MADYRDGLYLLPTHMQDAVSAWIENGFPHPNAMGSFFLALITGDLFEAFAHADAANASAMQQWARFWFHYSPCTCYGNPQKVIAWHEQGGLSGHDRGFA